MNNVHKTVLRVNYTGEGYRFDEETKYLLFEADKELKVRLFIDAPHQKYLDMLMRECLRFIGKEREVEPTLDRKPLFIFETHSDDFTYYIKDITFTVWMK